MFVLNEYKLYSTLYQCLPKCAPVDTIVDRNYFTVLCSDILVINKNILKIDTYSKLIDYVFLIHYNEFKHIYYQ